MISAKIIFLITGILVTLVHFWYISIPSYFILTYRLVRDKIIWLIGSIVSIIFIYIISFILMAISMGYSNTYSVQSYDNISNIDILLLHDYSFNSRNLAKAIINEDLESIDNIIKKDKKLLNKTYKFNLSMLDWSIIMDKYNSTEKLLELGAEINNKSRNGVSNTYFVAIYDNYKEIPPNVKYIKLLLKYNPKFNLNTVFENDTLLMRSIGRNFEVFKYLIEAGADINYVVNYKTPLDIAIENDKKEYIEYLIAKKS